MGRRGFTLIELLVVMAVLAVLVALLTAGVFRALMVADRVVCTNNLRQIGMAAHMYHEDIGTLPRPRKNGDFPDDPYGIYLDNFDSYTGPKEEWWAPFDNRPGAGPAQPPLDDHYSRGLLWPYLEENPNVFRCPQGFDSRVGSPTHDQPLQCCFGMNAVTNGPSGLRLTDIINGRGLSHVAYIWDHSNIPACANPTKPPGRMEPVKPYTDPVVYKMHYPDRHGKFLNILFCDNRVSVYQPAGLFDEMFEAR